MAIQVRCGVFETNSSSVHAFAFLNDAAYEEWVKGSYIDLRELSVSDYDRDDNKEYVDISDRMISHSGIGQVRKELPQERYYEHPDDCLLEAGIFPYSACCDEESGTPSQEWSQRCGGLNCLKVDPVDGGYNIYANWYAW